jgi:hypothetical protein
MVQHISMNVSISAFPLAEHIATLPFTRLTVTEISLEVQLQAAQLLRFLVVFPLLERFHFCGGIHEDETTDDILPVVFLRHLHTLIIRNTCSQRTIMSYLHTPALRHLFLHNLNLDFELPSRNVVEDGDSDDEDPDYSQSPWSDRQTGSCCLTIVKIRCID